MRGFTSRLITVRKDSSKPLSSCQHDAFRAFFRPSYAAKHFVIRLPVEVYITLNRKNDMSDDLALRTAFALLGGAFVGGALLMQLALREAYRETPVAVHPALVWAGRLIRLIAAGVSLLAIVWVGQAVNHSAISLLEVGALALGLAFTVFVLRRRVAIVGTNLRARLLRSVKGSNAV